MKLNQIKWKPILCWVLIIIAIGWIIHLKIKNVFISLRHIQLTNYWNFPYKTGDVFMTRTRTEGFLNSDRRGRILTRFFTSGYIDHVGVVYVDPKTKIVYFWEMTQHTHRLVNMHEYTHKCDSSFLIRQLKGNVNVEKFEAFMRSDWDGTFEWLHNFHNWYNRFAYPNFSCIPLDYRTRDFRNSRNCSTVATQLFASLGILQIEPDDPKILEVFPSDYGKVPLDKDILPFKHGYGLGDPIQLLI